jgi:S-adenosylmethionine hydrolase
VEADWQVSTLEIRDVFAKAAKMLASGVPIEELGKPHTSLFEMMPFMPAKSASALQIHVVHTDSFGNVITNLTRADFRNWVGDKKFTILLRSRRYSIKKIGRSYQSTALGDVVALFNSSGYLEIAINQGSASDLLGLTPGDRIVIEIHEDNTHSTLGI